MERYHGHGAAAVGTAKAILNLFRSAASPTSRARIFEFNVGCVATPADLATRFSIIRTTAVGTEDAGFTPVNLDPGGPASQSDFGVGFTGGEPTKTANSELYTFSLNQRATFRWVAAPDCELVLPATQNNGAALQSVSSGGTTQHEATILFLE